MTSLLATLDDSTLINLVLAGEAEFFIVLMDRHLAAVRKRIGSIMPNKADAEDLLQEVILKVWCRLGTFRFESSFRTWMTRVAINEALQSYRREQRMPIYLAPSDFEVMAFPSESPHQFLARVEEIYVVRSAVLRLPAKYRQVLILHDLEQLSVRETAQELQLSVAAVKTRLFRARRMLLIALLQSNIRGLAKAA